MNLHSVLRTWSAEERAAAALLVVDVQPDFLPGGALPVGEGDQVIAPIAELMHSASVPVVAATQDWHPRGHVSFASSHAGRQPFETIELHGHEQVLWPDHCVQGTPGAALHAGLPWERASVIVRKGSDPACDSYSGFRNNWNVRGERPPTGLAGYLRERGVRAVAICGLARDYCCLWSAEDARAAGFEVSFLWELTRPVDPGSDARVRAALARAGVRVVEAETGG
jgi:nicotinamidase/pyrazinamidase